MTDDIKDLDEKLKQARGPEKEEKEDRNGIQAGLELVVAIGFCTAIGYGLDKWLETKPLFLLIFFFVGVIVGFYNIYRLSMNVGYGVGYKGSDSQLHQDEKPAKKSSKIEESQE